MGYDELPTDIQRMVQVYLGAEDESGAVVARIHRVST
jgi:hypothetical protein